MTTLRPDVDVALFLPPAHAADAPRDAINIAAPSTRTKCRPILAITAASSRGLGSMPTLSSTGTDGGMRLPCQNHSAAATNPDRPTTACFGSLPDPRQTTYGEQTPTTISANASIDGRIRGRFPRSDVQEPAGVATHELPLGRLAHVVRKETLVALHGLADPLGVRPVAAEHEDVLAGDLDQSRRLLVAERAHPHVAEEVRRGRQGEVLRRAAVTGG